MRIFHALIHQAQHNKWPRSAGIFVIYRAQIACALLLFCGHMRLPLDCDIKHWHFRQLHRKNEEASDEFSLEFPNKMGKHIERYALAAAATPPSPREYRPAPRISLANNHNHQDRLLQTPNTNTRNRNPFKFRSQLTNCSISCVGEYP